MLPALPTRKQIPAKVKQVKMSRTILVALLSVALLGAIRCASVGEQLSAEVRVVEDTAEYFEQHPELESVQLFDKVEENEKIRYTFGKRVSGDAPVGFKSGQQTYARPQHTRVNFTYPIQGQGAVISFIDIAVEQVP